MELKEGISAVVTGGASGLGAGTARALAAKGLKVSILDLNEEGGRRVAAEIGGNFYKCDVTDEASVDEALEGARKSFGQERVLINCAGVVYGGKTARKNRDTGAFEAHKIAAFAKVININLVGTFTMIAKCAAGMSGLEPINDDGERGVVITTSSVAAQDGQMGQAAYAASKGGILSMTLPIARDLSKEGIRVCSILPGLFETPMFDVLPDDAKKALAASTPFPSRLGTADEYARLACHICENSMLNGEYIRIDGAVRLAAR